MLLIKALFVLRPSCSFALGSTHWYYRSWWTGPGTLPLLSVYTSSPLQTLSHMWGGCYCCCCCCCCSLCLAEAADLRAKLRDLVFFRCLLSLSCLVWPQCDRTGWMGGKSRGQRSWSGCHLPSFNNPSDTMWPLGIICWTDAERWLISLSTHTVRSKTIRPLVEMLVFFFFFTFF